MLKKSVSGIILALLLTTMLMFTFNVQPVKAGTIIVPDDYSTIQAAINVASPNDTIYVRARTYYENVVINKTLWLVGENPVTTIIDGRGLDVVAITVSNAAIQNFTIRNGYFEGEIGIRIENSTKVRVQNNNLEGSFYGLSLDNSSGNTISSNTIRNNEDGIVLWDSSNNIISGNNITVNDRFGVDLWDSSNNTVSQNNVAFNNYEGVTLYESFYNTIFGNNIVNNSKGISLYGWPLGSSNNSIYHNNFINNTIEAYLYKARINTWDDGYPSGGNYWSNYTGIDQLSGPHQNQPGSDGIGDNPHLIDANNRDRYPLMTPWLPVPDYPLAEWIESPNYTPSEQRNITYIIIHVMDGYFEGTIDWFENEESNVSAHYLVSQKGEIVQMVREKDIAWHAGNWEYNRRSIGIEHEDQGNWDKPNWATEELYQSSAALVRHLCDKYGIPKDRAFIVGHNEVPGVTKPCPGPYWDWDYFMGLVKGIPTARKFWAVWENVDYPVLISSNSTVSHFIFDQPQAQINFNVTGPSGTKGFYNITIPKSLLRDSPWNITIDGTPITDYSSTENTTHSFLYFTYTYASTFQVTIQGTWVVPEFPTPTMMPLLIILSMLAVVLARKRLTKKTKT